MIKTVISVRFGDPRQDSGNFESPHHRLQGQRLLADVQQLAQRQEVRSGGRRSGNGDVAAKPPQERFQT